MIQAVLFDLDGTFANTARDRAPAVNPMRAARGLPPVSFEATRPVTSTGARGLLRVGFDMTPEHADYAAMGEEFFDIFAPNLCVGSRLFPGMTELLEGIERLGLKWGIVTNKAERFAKPLIAQLALGSRC